MAEVWRGLPVAKALTEQLIQRREKLKERGVTPTLAIVRAGNKGDDIAYENGAMKRCEKIGIQVRRFLLPEDCTEEQLLNVIREINMDDTIHGCLLFRPMPDRAIQPKACALLNPDKDSDGMTPQSLATLFTGTGSGYPPCTAEACMEILDYYGVELEGKNVTVVGRSLVVGKPVSMMLQARNATVTMCHTRTKDLPAVCRNAEILVSTAGRAEMVRKEFLSPGQIVIDVGINADDEGNLFGDVAFAEAEEIVSAITPVPGGVGSVTTAVLAKHVIMTAEKMTGIRR
ncbi:MAG: bifunctional 5,10-methylenetetrahydrofolate dehydrogenase/5,10-methenyltetrahydrofolate cyclohydrolase [Eubacterium sp.]|nr:bifunctional 5,10-methylenetetrahydrofolate dehydrogenase/5,10-methenyltetrahydrofolate cyclohydrolase [Eubacterium sp.]